MTLAGVAVRGDRLESAAEAFMPDKACQQRTEGRGLRDTEAYAAGNTSRDPGCAQRIACCRLRNADTIRCDWPTRRMRH